MPVLERRKIMNIIRNMRKQKESKQTQAQTPKNPYDLNQLTERDIDFSMAPKIMAELDKLEEECKQKYGDDWFEHFVELTDPNYGIDMIEQSANEHIYEGYWPGWSGDPGAVIPYLDGYINKMKRLFGPEWENHIKHQPDDPEVNELLIKDTLKTGKWKELPECLQEEYQRRAEKING